MHQKKNDTARDAWLLVGGLVALTIGYLIVREFPSMRRELRLMRM